MSYYEDVYLKRLNRYGNDYQTRIQNQREKEFEDLLLKSVYRVDFEYNGGLVPAISERYRQDETETIQYLLTRVSLDIPNGTILEIPNKNNDKKPWMIYYLEDIKASGYNRYIVLKMTHFLKWKDDTGVARESWAYMYGQQSANLIDTVQSKKNQTVYSENQKSNFFVLPLNKNIQKDNYFEIGEGKLKEAYRVTGFDRQSTKGVEYVTVDPIYVKDDSPIPTKGPEDKDEDFYWLNGGVI